MTVSTIAERAEIRALAREVAQRELTPRAAALDAGDRGAFMECWAVLVELGLDRALLNEHHGGSGLGVLDLLGAIEELAVGEGAVAMCVLLCNAALATLTDEQLADVPAGARWALVPATFATEVTISDGRIDGRVACALGAHGADGLVFLLDGPEPAAWVLDKRARGCEIERDLAQLGLRAAPAASLELTGASCASTLGARHGRAGGGSAELGVAGALALLRAGTAGIAHGIARRAHEQALEYAHARRQGGVAIIEHDAVSDMLSAMAVRLACRPEVPLDMAGLASDAPDLAVDAARLELDGAQALAVKIAVTDAAVASTTDAVQVFGGTGYMVETGIEKLMRDAKYCQLFPEPNWVAHDELMRMRHNGRRDAERMTPGREADGRRDAEPTT